MFKAFQTAMALSLPVACLAGILGHGMLLETAAISNMVACAGMILSLGFGEA